MTNQSSILNEHDLKEFARMAMNIILEKYIYIYIYIGTARNFRMFCTYSSRTQ